MCVVCIYCVLIQRKYGLCFVFSALIHKYVHKGRSTSKLSTLTFHKENLDDTKRMTLTSNDNAIILTSVIENCVSYHRSCCGGWMVEEWGHWSLLWSPSSPAPLLVISLLYRDLPSRNINSYFCIPACILPSFDRSKRTFDFDFVGHQQSLDQTIF